MDGRRQNYNMSFKYIYTMCKIKRQRITSNNYLRTLAALLKTHKRHRENTIKIVNRKLMYSNTNIKCMYISAFIYKYIYRERDSTPKTNISTELNSNEYLKRVHIYLSIYVYLKKLNVQTI